MYCKDCKHWTKNEFEKQYTIDEYWANHYKAKTKFGQCSCSSMINGDGETLDNYYTDRTGNELIYDDAEGCASFETGECFGCIHFEWNKDYLKEDFNSKSNTPTELFQFDLISQIRKDMPNFLIETEGLTEEQAIKETEEGLEASKRACKTLKNEIENIKCDFMSKVVGSMNNETSIPLVTKTERLGWIKVCEDEALRAIKEGRNVLVTYVDGGHLLLSLYTNRMIKTLYPEADTEEVIKSITKLPERKDSIQGVIPIEGMYVWEEK